MDYKEILFLWYMNGRSIEYPNIAGYWTYEYNLDYRQMIEKLLDLRYLTLSAPEFALSKKKMPELKRILSGRGFSNSGKKEELIRRIIENLSAHEIKQICREKFFVATEAGEDIIKENEHIIYFHKNKSKFRFSSLENVVKLKRSNPKMTISELEIILKDEQEKEKERLRQETLNGYKKYGVVKRYAYLAALDKHTCSKCGNLDGKVFDVDKAVPGVNYPPMCDDCRCTTTAHFDRNDEEDDDELERIARDPETGKNYYVPIGTTWRKWIKEVSE